MDPKLLLVKAITLLYKESQSMDATSQSSDLVKQVINTIKFPEGGMDFGSTRENMQSLRATALWMCENPVDHKYDRAGLLQRIRVNVGDDEALYLAVEYGLDEVTEEDMLKKQILDARHELRSYMDEGRIKDIIKRAYHKSAFNTGGGEQNLRELVRDIASQLEPFTMSGVHDKIEGMVDEIDTANQAGMASLMERARAEASPEGVIQFGWQGLNRMTGEHCGIVRGESWVVGALQHNFKTGCTLSMFKQAALYNKPWMKDPKKKPLLLHISTENSLTQNVMWLYANLKENETGQECDLSAVDINEATRYVHERLSATGYHIKMCRMNPSDVSFHTIQDYVLRLEAEGYEVHLMVVDYLNMINKKGCQVGPAGFEVRDLFRRMRNFTSEHAIAFITPHQLSTEAKGLVRQGVENFVQEIANKGYYDSCKTIDQEVDMELYIHIVKINGASFLTMQRGKHRKLRPTPEKDLFIVLPFCAVGSIPDDIHGKDTTRKHAGGGAIGSGDEVPWFAAAA
jgi:hypothetical protein